MPSEFIVYSALRDLAATEGTSSVAALKYHIQTDEDGPDTIRNKGRSL